MSVFILVSAFVLGSVLWDSTEDIRKKLRFELQRYDF